MVAGLTIVFVISLLDRRAPRRLVAVGVATLAAALGYDALRAEHGTLTLAHGQATSTFERREPGGRVSSRALGETVVLETIEPDGTVVLARPGHERRLRVSPRRAATVAAVSRGPTPDGAGGRRGRTRPGGGARRQPRAGGAAGGPRSADRGHRGRVEPLVSGLARGLGIVALVSALGLLAAAIVAAVAAARGRSRLRIVARDIGFASAAPLLLLAGRDPVQPFIAFAVVAALAGPEPVALALAAGAAVMAGLGPTTGAGSIALVLAGAAAAVAANALGRSASAHVSSGRDPAWPSSAAAAAACSLVLALDGGRALRFEYGVPAAGARASLPGAGLVLGLTLLASLAGALLLAADALAANEARPASTLARRLGRRALALAAGLALISAGLIARGSGWVPGLPSASPTHPAR